MVDHSKYFNWYTHGNLEGWYTQRERADETAFIVGHAGVDVTFHDEDGNTHGPFRVQIVPTGVRPAETPGAARSESAERDVIVIGVRGHDELDDCAIEIGYLFEVDTTTYEITFVDRSQPGKVEARGLARQ